MPRDYRKEYDAYYGKKNKPGSWSRIQKSHRLDKTSRNKARRIMRQKYGSMAVQNKDIDHIDGNPQNNNKSNLKITTIYSNRAKGPLQKPGYRRYVTMPNSNRSAKRRRKR